MLSKKFHVITNRGNYLVKIKKELVWNNIYQWKIEIFTQKKFKIPIINKEINTYKKVSTFESGCLTYEKWMTDLLRLAKVAVRDYEEWLQRQEMLDQINKEHIISIPLEMVWNNKNKKSGR